MSEQRVYRLRRYYAQTAPSGPPVVLVPPLILAAEVYDDAPSTSAVTILREHGADPWVADFGSDSASEARRSLSSSGRLPSRDRVGDGAQRRRRVVLAASSSAS